MTTPADENIKIDTELALTDKTHMMHFGRKNPTLLLLQKSYDEGCKTLIDIGCNGGLWMNKTREIGYNVIGLDHTPYKDTHIIWDANNLSIINTNSFDVVQITETMEHLDTHPKETLNECIRIAKHSIILSVPGASSKWGGLQAKNVNVVEKINYKTHVWYIPIGFFYDNSCVIDNNSKQQWTVLRIGVK